MVLVLLAVAAVVSGIAVAMSRRELGLPARRILGTVAALVGLGLAVTTPTLVIHGESAPTVMGNTAIVALTLAAGLWLLHGFGWSSAASTGWLTKVLAAVLAGGLLVASTTFFLAFGAAIATLAALAYGVMLIRHPRRSVRGQGLVLIATSLTVIAAAVLSDLSTEGGFEVTGVVFAVGMGASTALLAATPTRTRPTADAS